LDVDFHNVVSRKMDISDTLEEHASDAPIEEVEHNKQELENKLVQQFRAIAASEEDSPMKAALLSRSVYSR